VATLNLPLNYDDCIVHNISKEIFDLLFEGFAIIWYMLSQIRMFEELEQFRGF
jgi:hypothetical protein